MYFKFCVFLLLCASSLYGNSIKCPNQLFVEPELYHLKRYRTGGTKQTATMQGILFGYERVKRYAFYVGVDAFFGEGTLTGHTGSRRSLRSKLSDFIIEGRLGYTLQKKLCGYPFFTPFVGTGYFSETNDFSAPSPIDYKTKEHFNYFAVGFLSGFNFSPEISMGLNFKVRFMMNGESEVTDDPGHDDVTLIMKNEASYRVELPFTYLLCCGYGRLYGEIIPFYEHRHFGGRQGYPFNFIDTKFDLLGAGISLSYRF